MAVLGLTIVPAQAQPPAASLGPMNRAHSLPNSIDAICDHKLPSLGHLAAKAVA